MKELMMKFLETVFTILCALLNWAKTPEGISGIVLIITLFFLVLTFQYAYRPYIGATQVNSRYDKETKDLTAFVKIKNTGNIPANGVHTNLKMIHNSKVLEEMKGTSKFVLFPEQETAGNPIFHNVDDTNLKNDQIDIGVEIKYELPIRFIFKIYTRKFKTEAMLRYLYSTGKFSVIAGESI